MIDMNYKRQQKYARLTAGKKVLELGGGAGDFNRACQGIASEIVSIDLEPAGKNVKKAEIVSFLRKNRRKFDMIYARHIIEHFEPEKLRKLMELCSKNLVKNGVLVLIFPNLKNINVATYEFWSDTTHARPYTETAVIKILAGAGFEPESHGPDRDSWDSSAIKSAVRWARFLFSGIKPSAPDYFIISKKKA